MNYNRLADEEGPRLSPAGYGEAARLVRMAVRK